MCQYLPYWQSTLEGWAGQQSYRLPWPLIGHLLLTSCPLEGHLTIGVLSTTPSTSCAHVAMVKPSTQHPPTNILAILFAFCIVVTKTSFVDKIWCWSAPICVCLTQIMLSTSFPSSPFDQPGCEFFLIDLRWVTRLCQTLPDEMSDTSAFAISL